MNITKLDMKKTLLAGSAMAVMSGFVPPVATQALAGTAVVPIDVQIVTAINLTGTAGLDFGRLALTNTVAMAGQNHTLSPAGATTTGAGYTVATTGTPGTFNITAGSSAASVVLGYTNNVTYAGGNIDLNQITFGGVALTAPVGVANSATAAGVLVGGGNVTVDIGGRLNFVAAPAIGNYTGQNATLTVVDVP